MSYRNGQLLVLAIAAVLLSVFFFYRWQQVREIPPFLGEARNSGQPIRVEFVGTMGTPGVYELEVGSTTRDLLVKAGFSGDLGEVPQVWVDMPVADGTVVEVWRDPRGRLQVARRNMSAPTMGLLFISVDLNVATEEDLESLPGIGEKAARAIITYRDSHGPFHSVDDLRRVKGIGEKTVEALKPLVTVGKTDSNQVLQ